MAVLAALGFAACSSKPENISVVKRSSSIIALDKESTELIGGDRGYLETTRKAENISGPSFVRKVEKPSESKTIALFKSAFTKPERKPETDELKELESGVNNSKYLYYSENQMRIGRIRLRRFR